MWVLITLITVKAGQDCRNSAESGGNWNHLNDGDGNGFAIVTLVMEVEAQSRIDDSDRGDALTKAAVREVGYVELESCTWILEVKEEADGP